MSDVGRRAAAKGYDKWVSVVGGNFGSMHPHLAQAVRLHYGSFRAFASKHQGQVCPPREETTVAHHNLAINHMAEGQVAEQLREQVVCLHVVLRLDFTLKPVHLVQLLGLVVTTAHKEVLGETHFPCEHQHNDLD